ncbi:hypothetical protein [Kurthia huakuii]|uniref:hypothetical protein n=1 Tax=Kurthia huakuii TaxID=1421019 RepID=UPI0013783F87|nr:hypothetical protein [Kurthia huakuii]
MVYNVCCSFCKKILFARPGIMVITGIKVSKSEIAMVAFLKEDIQQRAIPSISVVKNPTLFMVLPSIVNRVVQVLSSIVCCSGKEMIESSYEKVAVLT